MFTTHWHTNIGVVADYIDAYIEKNPDSIMSDLFVHKQGVCNHKAKI